MSTKTNKRKYNQFQKKKGGTIKKRTRNGGMEKTPNKAKLVKKKPRLVVIDDDVNYDLSDKPDDTKTSLKIPGDEQIVVDMVTESKQGTRLNEMLIDLMDKLGGVVKREGFPFKERAYKKAQETIMQMPTDITSPEQLKGKSGIGTTIYDKIVAYIRDGTLPILDRAKNDPIHVFTEIYGVGPAKAKELIKLGITTLEQLREDPAKYLNDTQQIGLKHYDDVMKRIPRSEIDEYDVVFKDVFKDIIMGILMPNMQLWGVIVEVHKLLGTLMLLLLRKRMEYISALLMNSKKEISLQRHFLMGISNVW